MKSEPPGFQEFVVARSPALLRSAGMLTGDAAAAADLLQTSLARTWPHWSRVADGHAGAYVRKVMVRVNASWRARLWNWEISTDDQRIHLASDPARGSDEHTQTDDRLLLAGALTGLPLRQRQAVVLRFFDDLSVEATAEITGSSSGTVKSQCAKGLAKLREALTVAEPDRTRTP